MPSNIFLSATWEYLAMFNYEVDPEILKPHLPPFTEIDYYQGKAIVSVVGFLFNNTKVMGIKWPGFINFEEVNLRYYIKYFDGNEWRRGVGFVSEIVPSRIIATMANVLYNEHYSVAKMSHSIKFINDDIHVTYNWKKKNETSNTMSITANRKLQSITSGSEEEFIFEHYFGYNKLKENVTIEYSLTHPRWEIYPIINYSLNCNIEELYGKEFTPFIQDIKPTSVMIAQGSGVSVKMPRRIS